MARNSADIKDLIFQFLTEMNESMKDSTLLAYSLNNKLRTSLRSRSRRIHSYAIFTVTRPSPVRQRVSSNVHQITTRSCLCPTGRTADAAGIVSVTGKRVYSFSYSLYSFRLKN